MKAENPTFLKPLEAFREKVALDASFTCQYSNHYYMAKPPELTLEFSGFSKENRRLLQQLSETFKDVESFRHPQRWPNP